MIVLLIHSKTRKQEEESVTQHERVVLQRGNHALDCDHAEVLDNDIDRIQQEEFLQSVPETVDGIEDRRHIIEQRQENIIEVFRIFKKFMEEKYGAEAIFAALDELGAKTGFGSYSYKEKSAWDALFK